MPPDPAGQATAGILISLDALTVQRAEQPSALEDAPVAIRRIGWIGRPIILVGDMVAGRDLPREASEREAWVRASIGTGAYAVVPFDEPSAERGASQDGEAVDQWRQVRNDQRATWLLTDRARQVGAARQAGLKVVLIGPSDPQPRLHRPDYQARDLKDAVGHLLTVDVFSGPATAPGPPRPVGGSAA
ncbi:MAG TPA: hypothetical protein VL687_07045 [Methylomirabilota bacterium]|jgi:hypothetical protein|nr:hypothetical protein [Methylomirabilota bacterium]